MPKYILLANWTDQGMRSVRDSAKRLDAGLAMGKQQGCVYETFFMTMGSFDMVSVIDAPDDETLAKHILTIGAGGNVRTITLKAFSEEMYRSIIAGLPPTLASG
jgi:uncharacterized protein with GYD domain